MEAKVILHKENTILGEGPVWDHRSQELWWVDIKRHLLHCYHPESGKNHSYDIGQFVGAAVPCKREGFILALHHGFAFYDPVTQHLDLIKDPEAHLNTRFNDGKCDPAGRFWAGTMSLDHPREPIGSLYCLGPVNLTHELSDITISNGLAWTSDTKTMYYIDTTTQNVLRFDYEISTGTKSNPSIALKFEGEDWPDGMCIDENDHLWIAFYGQGKVCCFDPLTQQKLNEIKVAASCTTSCAFGGENLDQLFITSAASEGDIHGGALFVCEPGVKGRQTSFFAGR